MGKAQRVGSRYNEDVDDVADDEQQGSQQEDQGAGSDDQQEQGHGSEQDEQDDDRETPPGKREAKYRRQRNEARAELRRVKAELDGKKQDSKADKRVRRVQEELAFVKAAAAEGVKDVEAAWKLADREMLRWEQEGDDNPPQLTGVEEAVAKVLDRYPYVAGEARSTDGDDEDDRVRPPSATTSGRATNGPKKGTKELDRGYLERKFPALQKRGSHRGYAG